MMLGNGVVLLGTIVAGTIMTGAMVGGASGRKNRSGMLLVNLIHQWLM